MLRFTLTEILPEKEQIFHRQMKPNNAVKSVRRAGNTQNSPEKWIAQSVESGHMNLDLHLQAHTISRKPCENIQISPKKNCWPYSSPATGSPSKGFTRKITGRFIPMH